MPHILVTGGAGFIGSNFVRYYLTAHPGTRITVLDALTYAGAQSTIHELEVMFPDRMSFVHAAIHDRLVLDTLLPTCDAVVHFAAETHVDRSIKDPSVFLTTNVLGTQILLDACVAHKIGHFHHISTDEVFGQLPLNGEERFSETTPYAPRNPYAASKAASDHLVRAYGITYELPYTITNCSNNFGPFQHPEKFIPTVIISALTGKPIPVYGDGLYVRDWLYVDDHCQAINLVLQHGPTNDTYCIGGMTDDVSNIQIITLILESMNIDPDKMIQYVPDRKSHDRRYAVDWSYAAAQLGYKPARDLQHRLVDTIQWYATHTAWWESLMRV